MKFVGQHEEYMLQILIDTGSTLSFIKETAANLLNLATTDIPSTMVTIANGQKLISSKDTMDFKWVLQGTEFTHQLRLLPMEGFNLILGCDWTEAHSPVTFDYGRMSVTTNNNGKGVRLQAQNQGNQCSMIFHQTLYKMLSSSNESQVEEIFLVAQPNSEGSGNPELEHSLLTYNDFFSKTKGPSTCKKGKPTENLSTNRTTPFSISQKIGSSPICFAAPTLLFVTSAYVEDVIVLTVNNFDKEIGQDRIFPVQFYALWCWDCKKFAPEIENLCSSFKKAKSVLLGRADVDEHEGIFLCSKYEVSGYPTIQWFSTGSLVLKRYEDAHIVEALAEFGDNMNEMRDWQRIFLLQPSQMIDWRVTRRGREVVEQILVRWGSNIPSWVDM